MPNASTLQFLLTLAKGIASQFGPNCEVVVHDLATNDPERSIVAIENGHVTGRKVGDGPSHVVLEALRGNPEQLHDHLSYLTRTKDGKILKSTTIYIRDDDGAPIGIFGINYDITLMLAMEETLRRENLAEEQRVLYVAMTRPKEKLILVDAMYHAKTRLSRLAAVARYPVAPETVAAGSAGGWKAELLRLLCQFEEINIAQSVAVGDGANDLPMLNLAGLGIAFHAKPKVKATARQSISTIGLDGILYFLGLKDSRIEQ